MRTYVLVHGGWVGGWSWREFARLLRAEGHEVYTPTLTGLGERVHLANAETGLSTHIQDIVNVIEYEDVHDIVLAGHSYGGMVITGVADRVPERIAHLVYLDAFLPGDGQSISDFPPPADRIAEGRVLPPQPPPNVDPASAERRKRWVGQPIGAFREKVRLTAPLETRPFSRTYIRATAPATPNFDEFAARVRDDSRWRYLELPSGHAMHWLMPNELAQILLELA